MSDLAAILAHSVLLEQRYRIYWMAQARIYKTGGKWRRSALANFRRQSIIESVQRARACNKRIVRDLRDLRGQKNSGAISCN